MDITDLPTTPARSIKKAHLVEFIENADSPSKGEIIGSIEPKQRDQTGTSYHQSNSTMRFTGDAEFITAMLRMLQPFLVWETSETRINITVKETKDRDADEYSGNHVLYFSVAHRTDHTDAKRALDVTSKDHPNNDTLRELLSQREQTDETTE